MSTKNNDVWKVAPVCSSPIHFVAYIAADNLDDAKKIFEEYFHIPATSFQKLEVGERYAL